MLNNFTNKIYNLLYSYPIIKIKYFIAKYILYIKHLLSNNKKQTIYADIVIIDDVFPSKFSLFRYIEYLEYLKYFKNIKIICTGESLPWIEKERTLDEVVNEFTHNFPEFSKNIIIDTKREVTFKAKLVYVNFYNNLKKFYMHNINNLPFIVNLYPGGGFELYNRKIDHSLKLFLSSNLCYQVITTQFLIKNYLINNNICNKNKITNIFGVVTSNNTFHKKTKIRYGFHKKILDICFVAYKYTQTGHDKGYDIVVDVAKKICKIKTNIHFHIVGSFTKEDIDVSEIKNNIFFYGKQNCDWLTRFYQDKDIIISPNIPFVLTKGSFDGFPTGSVIEAGYQGVAMLVTDELNMNNNMFINNQELIIIRPNIEDIVNKILYLYNNYIYKRNIRIRNEKNTNNLFI